MSKHYRYLFILLTLVILSAGVVVYALHNCSRTGLFPSVDMNIDQFGSIDRPPKIHPDYCETVIPPNIAPMNFLVEESGSQYYVKIHSKNGRAIQIFSRSPKITIGQNRWHELLNANRGEQLNFDVFVKTANPPAATVQWNRFSSITNQIANEDIDGFLVYRRIHPGHGFWRKMGIYQRDLHRFDESLILDNNYFKGGCLNCHTFCNNRTDKMFIGIRSALYGSSVLLIEDDDVNKIGTKFGYTSWHPSGRIAAYSINKVHQFFHTAAGEVRDVIDLDSLLAYYIVDSKTIKTSPQISKKDRLETYPVWSPDGRYLYFCSAPLTWSDQDIIPGNFNEIKYDLVRISYDIDSDTWGELETVLSAQDTGLSILLPRISPDGRWLLFCMCNYGCFPVYQESSDLYMIDLEAAQQTGKYEYRRLEINSDKSESWHSWSSNGRWIAFSSKRQSGVFTRTYLSYVDRQGRVHCPLLLPQKDPTYYDSCLWTYSVPELIQEPVVVTKETLGRIVRSPRKIPGQIPVTMATPKAGTLPETTESWLIGRE
ncbi:MAG: TolB family protein [Planctomycetota bacterium]